MATVNNGLINPYTLQPRDLTEYSAYRGVTDFSQIGQFAQFETGYSVLQVIQMPRFMEKLGQDNGDVQRMVNSFKHMLEYEFRGLEGLPDITGETYTITDGINEQQLINKVTMDTSVTISSNYFEKTGGLITKFSECYLTGIKDKMSQAKTYHGLIKNNILEPGPENEVFTFMYIVTDNTMMRIEKAYLLANAQLTKAETSMYSSNRSDINNKEMTIEWNCFPITGYEVDKAANTLLADITGYKATYPNNKVDFREVKTENVAVLDSYDYTYGIMDSSDKTYVIPTLKDARSRA